MWLINTTTLELEEFFGTIPPYAILSHTWGAGEVSFQDFKVLSTASLKPGFAKIRGTCEQAIKDKLQYCWVDTCCIDKTSSAELSEAINSMFVWYQNAQICYAYLADVNAIEDLSASKWFTRGWTLQELLAPSVVVFYTAEWKNLGSKKDEQLHDAISSASGIQGEYFTNLEPVWQADVAKRMSWAAKRTTTRVEDMAYCLLGIFDIHMPLLYGEGSRAFFRLQEEIIKQSSDQTIFCWTWKPDLVPPDWSSILAPCPAVFAESGDFHSLTHPDWVQSKPYHITNVGLYIEVSLVPTERGDLFLGLLNVSPKSTQELAYDNYDPWRKFCIVLETDMHEQAFQRVKFPEAPFLALGSATQRREKILIHCGWRHSGFWFPDTPLGMKETPESLLSPANFGIFMVGRYEEDSRQHLKVVFRTDNVSYFIRESLLVFSFSGDHQAKETGVVFLTIAEFERKKLALCFAVQKRMTESGSIQHLSCCNLVSLAGSSLEELAKQAEKDLIERLCWRQFAEISPFTVLLDDPEITYSSGNGPAKNLRLAYLAFNNKDLSRSLRGVVEPPWADRSYEEEEYHGSYEEDENPEEQGED